MKYFSVGELCSMYGLEKVSVRRTIANNRTLLQGAKKIPSSKNGTKWIVPENLVPTLLGCKKQKRGTET